MKVLVGYVAVAVLALGTAAAALTLTGEDEDIPHEPMPAADGLSAGASDEPAFTFDEGTGDPAAPAPATTPAPPGEGSGDDLLYRTSSAGAQPEPGTVHMVEREVRPDRLTAREPWLTYHAVFDPAIIPFKRNSAKDAVREDGALVVGDPEVRELEVTGNRTERGREVFYGSILVELEPGVRVPMPSVAPSSHVLSYETAPEVALTFGKDGADNFYVEGGDYRGRARVNFVMDAPSSWFWRKPDPALRLEDVPAALRPELPANYRSRVAKVASTIGIRASDGYAATLEKLVRWFRAFNPGELPPTGGDLYLTLALSKKGVCRHRVYAFVITAQGLGIPARYVSNEAHVFAEVFVPGPDAGWLRIDLGGGALGMDVKNGAAKTRHTVAGEDPFGFPESFRESYSHRAEGDESGTGDTVRGLPPVAAARPGTGPVGPGPVPGIPSRWGVPRAEPFPANDNKVATATSLSRASARVFRGDKLAVAGQVTAGGEPISGGEVRLELMEQGTDRILFVLGTATTAADGSFSAALTIPLGAAPGTFEAVAEYVGDARYAPSRSP